MSQHPFSRDNDTIHASSYTTNGYEKTKLKRIIVVACILVSVTIAISLYVLLTQTEESTYMKNATAAARKQIPNAKVNDLKVAGGFARATVNDPTGSGQVNSGNITIFKVNDDKSMIQLANGSSFDAIDLLELSIPLSTQAELTDKSIDQIKQDLANACNYDGASTPGYSGFDGSFNPNDWQISSSTFEELERIVTSSVIKKNSSESGDKKIICIDAIRDGSNLSNNTTSYISTFTLPIQFISTDGTLTKHIITYEIGPKLYRSYTLDGQKVESTNI